MKRLFILLVLLFAQATSAMASTFNPELWAGHWTGVWANTTFGSFGPMTLSVSFDPVNKTLFYSMDLGGNAGGVLNPAPVSGSGTYTDAGIVHDFTDPAGSGTVTFTPDTMTADITVVATPSIASVTVSAKLENGLMTNTYQVNFVSGAPATGKGKMLRRPIPPLNVGDLNGNGAHELAALEIDANGDHKVFVKDSRSRQRVSLLNFGKGFRSIAMVKVPDINGNMAPEIAVLAVNNTTGVVRILVKDSKTGINLRAIFHDQVFAPVDLVMVPGTGLGVLGMDDKGRVRVLIKSHLTGKFVRAVFLGTGFHATHAAIRPGSPAGIVVSGIRFSDNKVVAYIRNGTTGKHVRLLVYESDQIPVQILIENNTRVSILVCRATGSNTSLVRRNAVTGGRVPTIGYGTRDNPRQVMMVGNVGGTNANDIALLSNVRNTDIVRAVLRDGASRQQFRVIFFARAYKASGMASLKTTGGGTAADLAVHGHTGTNLSRLELRDLVTRSLVRTIPVP